MKTEEETGSGIYSSDLALEQGNRLLNKNSVFQPEVFVIQKAVELENRQSTANSHI